jgi:predicted DNA binding CopG/RHH family protein
MKTALYNARREGSSDNGQRRERDSQKKVQARKELKIMARKRKEINSWDEVPSFASEKEEQAWWDEHDISEELLDTFEPRSEMDHLPPPREKTITRPRKGPISVRMEADLVKRLKVLAGIKGIGYQTLLRQFVADRVYEEEKREGILR